MEITSGGTPGPRLAAVFAERANNAYCSVLGEVNPERLAQEFLAVGWRARKSSWTELEVENEWARFDVFHIDDGLMLAGFADPTRVDELVQVLQRFGLAGEIELWSDDGAQLLRELAY